MAAGEAGLNVGDVEGELGGTLARVLTVLRCSAAEPRLGGVLFFDLEPALLPLVGELLADLLADGARPRVVTLGSWAAPEDLWLRTGVTGEGFAVLPGALVERGGAPPPVVLVPDLGHAPLPVTQAAVTLLDADAAAAELFGHSMRWRPRARWLAAVGRAEAGRLSPHLLDRFPVRVDAASAHREVRAFRRRAPVRADDRTLLRTALAARPAPPFPGPPPALTAEAAREVVALMPSSASRRRDLALARTARALARVAGHARVGRAAVREAAALLGLPAPPPEERGGDTAERDPGTPPRNGRTPVPAGGLESTGVVEAAQGQRARSVAPGGAPVPLEPATVRPAGGDRGPYPEDDPEALPRFGSLRAPRASSVARAGAGPSRGHPVGVRPARDLRDVALIPTLLEAARFQRIRRARGRRSEGLLVNAADLRQYRRRPDSGRALVLVLDHSCHAGWDWAPALAPHLRWSYQHNASVSVVEFGHRDAADELTAERYRVDSLLHPRVLASLNRPPGMASPLAHALDLAVQELRRLQRNGRAALEHALLVVVTDGRGNVPLNASLGGRPPGRVGREGVTDALRVAAAVRTLPRAEPVVIAPVPDVHPELTAELAEALGGRLVAASRRAGAGERR
ncbi:hypothetical protein [Streptomyces radicis]|uniref:Magnesium chelatase n=1 Tax=Streptomyces radicis TaxID=1750517 RepID=A0A3A9W8B1_9ACTN|nr:hypothetical protein [Streptomyces radicis]RKN08583.1 hypothetical protein D7319_14380 [Streptomyces radicis]RKN21741.1 hypothetical protein D7318_15335 [Streptomyces radicis]